MIAPARPAPIDMPDDRVQAIAMQALAAAAKAPEEEKLGALLGVIAPAVEDFLNEVNEQNR